MDKSNEETNGEKFLKYIKTRTDEEVEIGKKIRCLNPEHKDETPSMHIYEKNALCYSCGYNVTLSKQKKVNKIDLIHSKLIELSKENSPEEFTEKRRYNPEIIKRLGLGICTLEVYSQLNEVFEKKDLEKSGLISNKRHIYINRIIFPYSETYFSARSADKNTDKAYKNLFPKGKEKEPYIIKGESKILVIVEGETDAIAAHHIFPSYNILAVGGAQSIKKFISDIGYLFNVDTLILCLDNDDTGEKFTFEALKHLKDSDYVLKQAIIPGNYKDIDELWYDKQIDSINYIKITEARPKDVLIEKDFEQLSKEGYKCLIEENFPDLWNVIDVCVSVVCINKLEEWTDPVNVNLDGAPSSEKTTGLSFFYNLEDLIYKSDNFTPKSFVSHAINVKKEELDEIDLLPKIKDKCFITPELAPIFAKRKEDLVEVIGILTRVFDGEGLESDSGSQGKRGYRGEYLFTMLGATTPLPKTAWNIMGRMGSRMFFLKMPDTKVHDDQLMDIMTNPKTYGEKIKICRNATTRYIHTIFKDGLKRNIRWDYSKVNHDSARVITECAKLLSKLRASIQLWDDDYSDDIKHETPLIEKPFRIANIFSNIAKGHAVSENRNYMVIEDVCMIPWITSSTMPDDRRNAFKVFLGYHNEKFSVSEIAEKMEVSEKVARKTMKTLEVLGIVKIEEFSVQHNTGGKNEYRYSLTEDVRKSIDIVENILIHCFPKNTSVKKDSVFLIPLVVSNTNIDVKGETEKVDNRLYTGKKRETVVYTLLDLKNKIAELDEGNGACLTKLSEYFETEGFDKAIRAFIEEGYCFENKPGFVKLM